MNSNTAGAVPLRSIGKRDADRETYRTAKPSKHQRDRERRIALVGYRVSETGVSVLIDGTATAETPAPKHSKRDWK